MPPLLSDDEKQCKHRTYERILLVFSVIGIALILGWVLRYSSYGIDFTDESLYLVSIANPFLYDWSLTQFGFIYHPLYLMLGGDIASLRQTNIIITFGLAWGLAGLFLKVLVPESATQKFILTVVAAGFAVASLVTFQSWLPTPSYNSLALQALLISSIGLLLAEKVPTPTSISGWLLIGIGGWLAFMAKPSTALALAVGVLLYIVLARKFSLRMLLVSVSCALVALVIGALMIDGSVYQFIDRVRTGVQFASYLGAGHSLEKIVRMDDFQLSGREKVSMILVAAFAFVATRLVYSEKMYGRVLAVVISALFLGVVISLTSGLVIKTADFGQFQGLMIWAAVFPAVLLGLVSVRQKIMSAIPPSHWAIALLFALMPHIYAFGTNGNYWQTGGYAAIFWLLAGIVLLGPLARSRKSWAFVLPLVLVTQAIAANLLQAGLEQPYRQPQPLRLNNHTIEIGARGSKSVLSEGYAKYFGDAISAARSAGFKPGMPVIDLTGQSPGILYALRAESIGQAWIIGGYPGSQLQVTAALGRVSCETLASAWLLHEPDGPRSIPQEVLSSFGGKLVEHYTQVASWQTAVGAGGYPISRLQILYKPTRQAEVFEACRLHKRSMD